MDGSSRALREFEQERQGVLRAVIWDLDGTLVDSLGDIGHSMNLALREAGLPEHPHNSYLHFVGEGAERLVAKAAGPTVGEVLRRELLARYRAYYAEHLLDTTKPFPGVAEVLAGLEARRMKLAVLSNKPDAPTKRIVAALFPKVSWAAIYGERMGIPRKPDPASALALASELKVAPASCAFVGDTGIDMKTARSAGMRSVGVYWGFRAEELEADGACRVVRNAQELSVALTE